MHFGSVSSAPAQELSLDGASSYVKKLQLPSTSAAHLSGLIQKKKKKTTVVILGITCEPVAMVIQPSAYGCPSRTTLSVTVAPPARGIDAGFP